MYHDEVLMYLRKSRADNPQESVEEVLSKHETMLQELAEKQLGGRINENHIYREIVSGETIDERPAMLTVLSLVEDPAVKGVVVVEPQRLSRGDLEDCGRIVNTFRYSNTKIITLQITYDLSDKMQRKFFEQELVRGNDYLEYTKEILLRGRILSIQNGNFIGSTAPYGYDKATIDGRPTLKPNDSADVVRLIFDLYVNSGQTPGSIADHLNSMGIKPMRDEEWSKSTIHNILTNPHYKGVVYFGRRKTKKTYQDGQIVTQRYCLGKPEDIIMAKGKHQAIVSDALFDAAQERFKNNPRSHWSAPLQNPLAGLLYCHHCGKTMRRQPYLHARDRYMCTNQKKCSCKSALLDEVMEALIFSLEREILPDLNAKLLNDDGKSEAIQRKNLERLTSSLDELKAQEARQYELLEKGIYSEIEFLKRRKEIGSKIDNVESRISVAKKELPKEIDYGERIVKLKDAISALRNEDISIREKNRFLKTIVRRVEYEFLSYQGRNKTEFRLHVFLLI